MAEGKLLKYRVVAAATEYELQLKLNALAEQGYILHDFTSQVEQEFKTAFYAVMKLGENDYSDVIQIKDVAPELATEAIANGLEPVSMSLSTKFIRMVRRKST
jgi:hypothetical protein